MTVTELRERLEIAERLGNGSADVYFEEGYAFPLAYLVRGIEYRDDQERQVREVFILGSEPE